MTARTQTRATRALGRYARRRWAGPRPEGMVARHRSFLRRVAEGEIVTVDVQTEIVINRPVELVARYAGNPTNAPRWYANIDSVEWATPPPAVVGSRMAFVARFLGRRLAYTYEVVELVADARLVMRTAHGPFPMETTYAWSSVDDGSTLMSLRNRGEPAGFAAITAPMMAAAMRRANRNDLARLKQLLEAAP